MHPEICCNRVIQDLRHPPAKLMVLQVRCSYRRDARYRSLPKFAWWDRWGVINSWSLIVNEPNY